MVVALVLVIACANLAGFLLARAVDRRQLVSQLLVATILLALTVDWRVLGFSILVSVVAGVFFGLVPALQATRLDLASVIRAENTGGGRKKLALRNVLVGGQVAVSMVLLVIAGLFARSLDVARKTDAGFGAQPAAMVWIGLPVNLGAGVAVAGRDRVVRNVAAMPGAEAVGLTSNIHLNTLGVQGTEVTVPGIEPPPGRTTHDVDRAAIDTGFIAGREGLHPRRFRYGLADGHRQPSLRDEVLPRARFPRPAVSVRHSRHRNRRSREHGQDPEPWRSAGQRRRYRGPDREEETLPDVVPVGGRQDHRRLEDAQTLEAKGHQGLAENEEALGSAPTEPSSSKRRTAASLQAVANPMTATLPIARHSALPIFEGCPPPRVPTACS